MAAMAALCVMTTAVVPSSAFDAGDHLQHHLAGLVVECAGGLVAQQHIGALDDGAGNRHALLLAARQLRREVVLAARQPHQANRLVDGIGLGAMSVTMATFSRTVRLGIRL
jgi:hypothetical protein